MADIPRWNAGWIRNDMTIPSHTEFVTAADHAAAMHGFAWGDSSEHPLAAGTPAGEQSGYRRALADVRASLTVLRQSYAMHGAEFDLAITVVDALAQPAGGHDRSAAGGADEPEDGYEVDWNE
jgi:hypothetical protein